MAKGFALFRTIRASTEKALLRAGQGEKQPTSAHVDSVTAHFPTVRRSHTLILVQPRAAVGGRQSLACQPAKTGKEQPKKNFPWLAPNAKVAH